MMTRQTVISLIAIVTGVLLYAGILSGVVSGIFFQVVLLLLAIYLTAFGADILVEASISLASMIGVSQLVIGLTVVAFGTSAPEILVSLIAGFRGSGDIAIANVAGSNIFNVCFILGLSALFVRGGLRVDRGLISRDAPVLFLGTALLFLFVGSLKYFGINSPTGTLLDYTLERGEAITLLILLVGYFLFLYYQSKKRAKKNKSSTPTAKENSSVFMTILKLVIGMAILVGGCSVMIGRITVPENDVAGYGAIWFAHLFEIPDYIVGMTIVAAGTSAPELSVSLAAAVKGSHDISTGNILGSVILNLFGVTGLAGLIVQPPLSSPITVSADIVPALAGLSILLILTIIFMWSRRRLSRLEGLILLGAGIAYLISDTLIFR